MKTSKKLQKEIRALKAKICDLEQKRSRSQAALVAALVEKTAPKDEDVSFFNLYTLQINDLRESLRKKQKELDSAEKF